MRESDIHIQRDDKGFYCVVRVSEAPQLANPVVASYRTHQEAVDEANRIVAAEGLTGYSDNSGETDRPG